MARYFADNERSERREEKKIWTAWAKQDAQIFCSSPDCRPIDRQLMLTHLQNLLDGCEISLREKWGLKAFYQVVASWEKQTAQKH